MTRINVVPPSELSDLHLLAEYRELPRVFTLIRKAQARGELAGDPRNPASYTLGEGHVRFFYDKAGFLIRRHSAIRREMVFRGFKPLLPDAGFMAAGIYWFRMNDYFPSERDMEVNRQRIAERTQ